MIEEARKLRDFVPVAFCNSIRVSPGNPGFADLAVDEAQMHAYAMIYEPGCQHLDTKSVEGVCLGGCIRKLNRMIAAIYNAALATAGLKNLPVQRAGFGR